jgi:hypothetical protein
MSFRRLRPRWSIALAARALCALVAVVTFLAWRGRDQKQAPAEGAPGAAIQGRASTSFASESPLAEMKTPPDRPSAPETLAVRPGPTGLDDPRLTSLRVAAESWRRFTGPRRLVVDQVCLVDDVPSFLEAIGMWDERHFFPILLERPSWVLPFLRAFRPARVVRYAGSRDADDATGARARASSTSEADARWREALKAVARAWSDAAHESEALAAGGGLPRRLGATPPGIVLSEPASPMLAGAVALAAGRFQRLVRFEPHTWPSSKQTASPRKWRYADMLDEAGAAEFALRIEARVAGLVSRYDSLGDDCDFLTLAGEWPYRYHVESPSELQRGMRALDDLIGRIWDRKEPKGFLQPTKLRWAYAGRLLGDPAASVYRAMCALFLQPSSALLWNTYGGGNPWSEYDLSAAALRLRPALARAGRILHHSGPEADLASWHRVVDPVNPFDLNFFNSTGGPQDFSIWIQRSHQLVKSYGIPADMPPGVPAAVAMIHSHSVADPANPQTIGGRWLAQGAFVYFGSVHEPFLHAFRPPGLVAKLMTAGMPMVAALRQGETETFGVPWRLVYLGDPLYRLERGHTPIELVQAMSQPNPQEQIVDPLHGDGSERVSSDEWLKLVSDGARLPLAPLVSASGSSPRTSQARAFDTDAARLAWCMDAAVLHWSEAPAGSRALRARTNSEVETAGGGTIDWRSVLREIHRERLAKPHRSIFDELLIDTLTLQGSLLELQSRLVRIPAGECGPLIWQAIETCTFSRLARLADDAGSEQSFRLALDLWDEVIRLPWPPGRGFPDELTERVAALAELGVPVGDRDAPLAERGSPPPPRLLAWHKRVMRAAQALAAGRKDSRQAMVARKEADRVADKLRVNVTER